MGRKEPFYLFVGDLHVGSIEAVTLPAEVRNDRQKWLAQGWADLVKRTKAEAKTKSLRLMLGGDLVDLANIVDAQEIAVELLRPLANVADEVWGVYGTPYHVGEDGVEDRSIYGQLGARGARRAQRRSVGVVEWAGLSRLRLGAVVVAAALARLARPARRLWARAEILA